MLAINVIIATSNCYIISVNDAFLDCFFMIQTDFAWKRVHGHFVLKMELSLRIICTNFDKRFFLNVINIPQTNAAVFLKSWNFVKNEICPKNCCSYYEQIWLRKIYIMLL